MKKRKLYTVALAAMIGFGLLAGTQASEAMPRSEIAKISVNQKGTNFNYWNRDSESWKALTGYVKDVTDSKSRNFIPKEDRVAVFDFDGTLFCETTPSYIEWMLFLDRALDDPSYTPTEEDRAYAEIVKGLIYHVGTPNSIEGTGLENSPHRMEAAAPESVPKDLDRGQAVSQNAVFAGMTLAEYDAYVKKFMETPAEGMKNLKRGDSFYLPMVEVISYLRSNDFKVFIVSGSDRQAIRVFTDGVLPVEKENIIGTDIQYLASNQGDKDGLDYMYTKDDSVVRGQFTLKNIKMNKVSNIVSEIGRQPVLAFGNSSGDSSMFNYTITNNKYKAMSFALLCDDTERELGDMKKADKMRASCLKYGWIPVSMRDDFKTIYGDDVTRADR